MGWFVKKDENDMEYPTQWTCETASSTICTVTATSTGNNITYHDWLFVSGIQIFLFSFIAIGLIFSLLKQKK